jgi:hypothetical protein
MSGFLNNLAARARGTLPRLAPRRPAPFETLGDRAEPAQNDSAPSPVSVATPASAPAAIEAASPLRSFAPTARQFVPAAATAGNAAPPPPPVPHTTPAPAALSRRMTSSPPAATVGPAALTSTQPVTSRAATLPHALMTNETPAAAHAAASPSTAPAAHAGTARDVVQDMPRTRELLRERDTLRAVADAPPASLPSIAPVPSPPAPLLPHEDTAPRRAVEPPQGKGTLRTATPQQSPAVEVHIGTIEVVMDPPRAIHPAPATPRNRGISLDDFLDGTGGR